MRVDRVTGRIIVTLLLVAAVAWVQAALHASHYYRLTYAACERGATALLCNQWRQVALFRTIVVVALAAALYILNERRQLVSQ